MEFEQIVKRLEWLDDEHRKDKAALNSLEKQISSVDNEIKTLKKEPIIKPKRAMKISTKLNSAKSSLSFYKI